VHEDEDEDEDEDGKVHGREDDHVYADPGRDALEQINTSLTFRDRVRQI
jgi:hypothetical protein